MCIRDRFCIAVSLFLKTDSTTPPTIVRAFEWFRVNGIQVNFGFQIDQLSLMMIMIITGIGSLIHLYSIGYMSHDKGFYKFFTYLNLFIFSMLLLVMGSNYLILFIGWEGVGLCSYPVSYTHLDVYKRQQSKDQDISTDIW